jgi:hypothetical protein
MPLFDAARHEPLRRIAWDEARVRAVIAHIVRDAEARFASGRYWSMHPRDADGGETAPAYPLYHGAAGVIWALRYLQAVGATTLENDYAAHVAPLRKLNAQWLAATGLGFDASYLMGDTGILLLQHWMAPDAASADRLAELIASNLDSPTRELMWGSPGTLLAALFLHEATGATRWADLFCTTARKLWSQLLWSDAYQCRYWTQDMYGQCSTYLDAVHGFVATASPLIRGCALLTADEWLAWQACIVDTVRKTATRDGALVNWRAWLTQSPDRSMLMQFCHGAPGFVVCLADLPGSMLDDLLIAAGEAIWAAGPLTKGSNLCHGTGGNGYAFLKLYARTHDEVWLARARAFAMHGIEQTLADTQRFGRMRHSLWTGDPGFAIYLWDCIRAAAQFPTLDVFFSGG